MSIEAILQAIPHRPPFLLLDSIVEQSDVRIICKKTFTGEEFWYAGHYPEFPLTPGVILCEAIMQAGAVLLSTKVDSKDGRVPVATSADRVQFKQMIFPNDTVEIEAEIVETLSGKFYMKGRATKDGKIAVRLEFACTLVEIEK